MTGFGRGTTSAHAENTTALPPRTNAFLNYLRARGEYRGVLTHLGEVAELPPRTRRIQHRTLDTALGGGTTSAHAENTTIGQHPRQRNRNYLRARGEYLYTLPSRVSSLELPPRTRRIRRPSWTVALLLGTTSAHAENTHSRSRDWPCPRNYLRARGEYSSKPLQHTTTVELPPRTRRILLFIIHTPLWSGTTSAHAENTWF